MEANFFDHPPPCLQELFRAGLARVPPLPLNADLLNPCALLAQILFLKQGLFLAPRLGSGGSGVDTDKAQRT